MTKILHHKSFHYFLIGLVTAGVSSFFNVLLVGSFFEILFVLIPGFLFGSGVVFYLFFVSNHYNYKFNITKNIKWVLYSTAGFIIAFFGSFVVANLVLTPLLLVFESIIGTDIKTMFNVFRFVSHASVFVGGVMGAISIFFGYKFIAENPNNFHQKNLIGLILAGSLLSLLGFYYLGIEDILQFLDQDSIAPLFFIWQPPMLALLGYIDSPKKNGPEGGEDEESKNNGESSNEENNETAPVVGEEQGGPVESEGV